MSWLLFDVGEPSPLPVLLFLGKVFLHCIKKLAMHTLVSDPVREHVSSALPLWFLSLLLFEFLP